MKHCAQTLALVLSFATTAVAGPLQKEQVAADAKWLLHADLDEFRATKVGGYVVTEILEKQLAGPIANLKRQFKFEFDPDRILDKINSITVYGTDYQSPRDNSVLMIKTDPDLQTAFVGVMAGLALAGTNAPVKQTQVGPVTFYSLKDQVFFAVLPGKLVAVGKSRGIVQKAADVLAGKAANLKSSKVFSEFADVKKTFFFFGVAEAFNSDAVVAPQAKLLQMADGGRVVLGEHADQLFLDLALKAKSSEIVTQMQQVVQGIIALASLGQPENKDLAQLVQAVKVSADDRIVNVSVEYPVDKVIQKLGERWWAPHLGKHQPANENGESDPPAGPPSDRDKN